MLFRSYTSRELSLRCLGKVPTQDRVRKKMRIHSMVKHEVSTLMPTFLERHTLDYKERYAKSLVASTTLLVHSKSQLPILVAIDTPLPQGVQESPQARDAQGMNLKAIAITHVIMIAHTCKMWMSFTNKKMSHYIDNEDVDRKSTRLNSSHSGESRMPSSA